MKSPGYVAKEGEERKFKHYEHLANDYDFIPISVETLGTLGESGLKFIQEVGGKSCANASILLKEVQVQDMMPLPQITSKI